MQNHGGSSAYTAQADRAARRLVAHLIDRSIGLVLANKAHNTPPQAVRAVRVRWAASRSAPSA